MKFVKKIIEGQVVYVPIDIEESDEMPESIEIEEENDVDNQEEIEDNLIDEDEDEDDEKSTGHSSITFSFTSNSKKGGRLMPILPFLSEEDRHQIVEKVLRGEIDDLPLPALMPFISTEDCDAIFLNSVKKGKKVAAFAPFVSRECLNRLIDDYIEGKYPNLKIDGLYPFLDNNSLKKLFHYVLKQKKED